VPAADQVVPGPAALGPAHHGADLRSPLDERDDIDDDADDDDDNGIPKVTRGAGRQRDPPQDHQHRLFVKHELEQGEPLRAALMDPKDFVARGGGGEDSRSAVRLVTAGPARKIYFTFPLL